MTVVSWRARLDHLLDNGFTYEGDVRWFTGPAGLLQVCRDRDEFDLRAVAEDHRFDALLAELDDRSVAFGGPPPSQRAVALVQIALGRAGDVATRRSLAEAFQPAGGSGDPAGLAVANLAIDDLEAHFRGVEADRSRHVTVPVAASRHAHGEVVLLSVRAIDRVGLGIDVVEAPFQRIDRSALAAITTAATLEPSKGGFRFSVVSRRSGLPLEAIGGPSLGLGAAIALRRLSHPDAATLDPAWVFTGAVDDDGAVCSLLTDSNVGEYGGKLTAAAHGVLVYPAADRTAVERIAGNSDAPARLEPVSTVAQTEALIQRHLAASAAYQHHLQHERLTRSRRALIGGLVMVAVAVVAVLGLLAAARDRPSEASPPTSIVDPDRQNDLAGWGAYDVQLTRDGMRGSFSIDRTEVTNKQYRVCVQAVQSDRPCPLPVNNRYDLFDPANEQSPVTGVSPADAELFCEFANDSGWGLPTHDQYVEVAQQNLTGEYPQGRIDDADIELARQALPNALKSVDADAAPLHDGLLGGIIGNAAEWTRTSCPPGALCTDLESVRRSPGSSLRYFGLSFQTLQYPDSLSAGWLTQADNDNFQSDQTAGLPDIGFRCATPTKWEK